MISVFRLEPTAPRIKAALAASDTLLMSSVTLAECCLVLAREGAMTPAEARVEIEAARIEIVPPDAAQAVVAAEARRKYPIRFGDAFVYALSKARDLPVLTLDAEFAKTDAALVPLT